MLHLALAIAGALTATSGQPAKATTGGDATGSLVALGTAVGVVAGVLVTSIGVFFQRRQNRVATGLDILYRFLDQWDGEDMRGRRVDVAEMLLYFRTTNWPEQLDHKHREILDVLNFFEYLAFFVCEAKVVRYREAWSIFYPWATRYWFAAEELRISQRDPQAFAQYKRLVTHFLRLYARARVRWPKKLWQKGKRSIPTQETVNNFLRYEMTLAEIPPLSWRPRRTSPAVTGVNPNAGSEEGGQPIAVEGSGFRGAVTVHFGSRAATQVNIVSDTTIACLSPPGKGTVEVAVQTPTGKSLGGPNTHFTYNPPAQTSTLPTPRSRSTSGRGCCRQAFLGFWPWHEHTRGGGELSGPGGALNGASGTSSAPRR